MRSHLKSLSNSEANSSWTKINNHKTLKQINVVIDSLKVPNAGLSKEYGKLNILSKQLFKQEEELLIHMNHSGLKAHQLVHESLLAKLDVFSHYIQNDILDPKELVSFLETWLKAHIIKGIE